MFLSLLHALPTDTLNLLAPFLPLQNKELEGNTRFRYTDMDDMEKLSAAGAHGS